MISIPPKDNRQHILNVAQQIIGNKGFAAVGLNEVLSAANVPKGSFYHYFSSKEAFGAAMLEDYFSQYLNSMEPILNNQANRAIDNLMTYWQGWVESQGGDTSCGQKCLAVKLGAEVSDLSPAMRTVLDKGTQKIVKKLSDTLAKAAQQGDVHLGNKTPQNFAEILYQLWLGASLMAKITQSSTPLNNALNTTKQMLMQP